MLIECADDHRLFCGDLGNEVNDEVLTKAFTRFDTFNMARVSIFLTPVHFSARLTTIPVLKLASETSKFEG